MVYREPNDQDEGDLETGTRVCKTCATRQPMSHFHWANQGRHRRRKCKACVQSRAAVVRSENLPRHQEGDRWRSIRRKYGLTKDAYFAIHARQGGVCGICARELVLTATHVDHDHSTGAVRGLLCFTCNTALGKFRDSTAILLAAIDYLDRARKATA